eukprot:SAG31_NODE_9572_length_1257_cov_1.313472_2_plen_353_part_01
MLALLDRPEPPGHGLEVHPAAVYKAMAPPLLCALLHNERLDLRAKLQRLGVCSVEDFVQSVEGLDTLSVINVPINKLLRAVKERPIGVDTLKQIESHITVSKGDTVLEGCKLFGKRGTSWDELKSGELKKLLAKLKPDADGTADVVYLKGDGNFPLILGIPCGGLRPCDGAGEVRTGANLQDSGTLQLGQHIAKRFLATCGAVPHIVLCTIRPASVMCSESLGEGVNQKSAATERAREAWCNYHTLIEVAKSRAVSTMQPNAAFVEIHSTAADRMQDERIFHLGYGLATYPLRQAIESSVSADNERKKQDTSTADEKGIAAAFNSFDRDGSGEIDKNELKLVAEQLGVPMSEV